jgi:hypothetical protein
LPILPAGMISASSGVLLNIVSITLWVVLSMGCVVSLRVFGEVDVQKCVLSADIFAFSLMISFLLSLAYIFRN